MSYGIIISYRDQLGLFSIHKKSEVKNEPGFWILPCRNGRQESKIYRYLIKHGSHNYLINLTSHHSVKASLLFKFS